MSAHTGIRRKRRRGSSCSRPDICGLSVFARVQHRATLREWQQGLRCQAGSRLYAAALLRRRVKIDARACPAFHYGLKINAPAAEGKFRFFARLRCPKSRLLPRYGGSFSHGSWPARHIEVTVDSGASDSRAKIRERRRIRGQDNSRVNETRGQGDFFSEETRASEACIQIACSQEISLSFLCIENYSRLITSALLSVCQYARWLSFWMWLFFCVFSAWEKCSLTLEKVDVIREGIKNRNSRRISPTSGLSDHTGQLSTCRCAMLFREFCESKDDASLQNDLLM